MRHRYAGLSPHYPAFSGTSRVIAPHDSTPCSQFQNAFNRNHTVSWRPESDSMSVSESSR